MQRAGGQPPATDDGAATATDADGAGAGGTREAAPVLALADFNPEDPSELAVKAGERLTPTGALGLGVGVGVGLGLGLGVGLGVGVGFGL